MADSTATCNCNETIGALPKHLQKETDDESMTILRRIAMKLWYKSSDIIIVGWYLQWSNKHLCMIQ